MVPPAGPGSLGDEAMIRALLEGLGGTGLRAALVRGEPGLTAVPAGCDAEDVAWPREAAALAGRPLLVLGADVLDGFYGGAPVLERCRLVRLAARCGAPTALVGMSLNAAPDPAALAALRGLPASTAICCRDPRSAARARILLGRPVALAADLAFLLRPDPTGAEDALDWVADQRSAGRRPVALNANGLVRRLRPGWDAAEPVRRHAELAAELLGRDPGLALVLVPHDRRAAADDAAMARAVREALPRRDAARVRVADGLGPAAVKALCAGLDAVVTGRMHLAIAALGAGRPALCMDYQGKVEGLYAHFGLRGLTYGPDELRRPRRLARRVLDLLGDPALAGAIRAGLPRVRRLARLNLDPWAAGR